MAHTTTGYIRTTEGLRDAEMDIVTIQDDPKRISTFLNRQCTTGGWRLIYAIASGRLSSGTKRVIAVYRDGKFSQRDARALLDAGYDQFAFSWSWAPKTWDVEGDRLEVDAEATLSRGVLNYREGV